MSEHQCCHEPVDSTTRKQTLERDRHRCQLCGRKGPRKGGEVALEVHHQERTPADMAVHDLPNLTTLCVDCHDWHHKQPAPDGLPVELSADDTQRLRPHDYGILHALASDGPMMTGEVAATIQPDLSNMAVRERLWLLMGLDQLVESREEQLVDQDADSGAWGLAEQIERSARGHVPADTETLLQRIQDEQARQALIRGIERKTIANVFDVHWRTTYYMESRAYAYDFPLDAMKDGDYTPVPVVAGGSEGDVSVRDAHQQQLDMTADGGGQRR